MPEMPLSAGNSRNEFLPLQDLLLMAVPLSIVAKVTSLMNVEFFPFEGWTGCQMKKTYVY